MGSSHVSSNVIAKDGDETISGFAKVQNKYYADAANADQGATGNGRSIKGLVDTIGTSTKATIVISNSGSDDETNYTISTDETIPSNINLEIDNGALLNVDSGKTLTINGPFDAGPYQVFNPDADVNFENAQLENGVNIKWFGAIGDGTIHTIASIDPSVTTGMVEAVDPDADTSNSWDWYVIQSYVHTLCTRHIDAWDGYGADYSNDRYITLSGDFITDRPIYINNPALFSEEWSSINIRGLVFQGVGYARIKNTGANVSAIKLGSREKNRVMYSEFNNLKIYGDGYGGNQATTSHGIHVGFAANIRINNCEIKWHGGSGIFSGYSDDYWVYGYINHSIISNNAVNGIYITQTSYDAVTNRSKNVIHISYCAINSNGYIDGSLTYDDSIARTTDSHGIVLATVNATVIGNAIEVHAGAAIYYAYDSDDIMRQKGGTVTGNYIEGNLLGGNYFVYSVSDLSIYGNYYNNNDAVVYADDLSRKAMLWNRRQTNFINVGDENDSYWIPRITEDITCNTCNAQSLVLTADVGSTAVKTESVNLSIGSEVTLFWRGSVPDTESDTWRSFLQQQEDGDNYWDFGLDQTNRLRFVVYDGGAYTLIQNSTTYILPIADDKIHAFAMDFTNCGVGAAGEINFYIDGKLLETFAVSAGAAKDVDLTTAVKISGRNSDATGSRTNATYIFSRILTAAEHLDLFRYGLDSDEADCELALEPEGIQPIPGQWLDYSGNGLHAKIPVLGSSLSKKKTTFETRWTTTWSGSHEAQYIGGINEAVLPADCYIESIIGVISGATIEDIIIGDGSDTDYWVVATVGLAAGTTSFTIANHISDGTNYKMVVDPDANFTGSIEFIIKGFIL